jgi:hypothetical protein
LLPFSLNLGESSKTPPKKNGFVFGFVNASSSGFLFARLPLLSAAPPTWPQTAAWQDFLRNF